MAARFGHIYRSFSINSIKLSTNGKNAIGGGNLVAKVTITNDGKTIVGWHPDAAVPYEMSKPINIEEAQTASLIEDSAMNSALSTFKHKHPEVARQELMRLTHTTKHRWFPRSRDKRAKTTPMDRPYL